MSAAFDSSTLIDSDPGYYGGRPFIRAKRVTLQRIGILYSEGMNAQEIADDYNLCLPEVHAALCYYSRTAKKSTLTLRSKTRSISGPPPRMDPSATSCEPHSVLPGRRQREHCGGAWAPVAAVDVATADSSGMRGRPDADHLQFSASVERVLVSANEKDFVQVHGRFVEDGRSHHRVVIMSQQAYSAGERIRRWVKLRERLTAQEMVDRIEYRSHWGEP